MSFLHAGLLAAGLAAVAIPILIHLLMRRRRTPVPWGAMRFLLEAYKRTRRRLLIQRWLLLASRCLLLAALAFVLGRPLLSDAASRTVGGRTLYLLIDNSIASATRDTSGRTALDRHLEAARDALDQLGEGDQAGLVLLATPVDRTVLPATANLAAVRALLADLEPADSPADLPGGLTAVASSRGESAAGPRNDRAHVLVLSDFARGSVDLDATPPRLPAGVRLAAPRPPRADPAGAPNVSIRSIDPLRPTILADQLEQAQTLTIRLVRSTGGNLPAGVSRLAVRAETPGTPGAAVAPPIPLGETAVAWSAGQTEASATVALDVAGAASAWSIAARQFPAVILAARIDDDPLPRDNLARAAVQVREALRVGIIGDGAVPRSVRFSDPESLPADQWVRLALRPREDSAIEIVEIDPGAIDAARLAGLDALIITAPDRVSEGDWPRLRLAAEPPSAAGQAGRSGGAPPPAADAGAGTLGLLVVMPPGPAPLHTWSDAMIAGLGLEWTIAREARDLVALPDPPRLVVGPVPAESSLLAPLRPELPDLVRSVNVLRVLPVAGAAGPLTTGDAAGSVELALSDGTPLLITASLGDRRRMSASAAQSGVLVSGGVVAFFAASLDLRWTDLPVKPLMVPLMQELVRQGVGPAQSAQSLLAGRQPAAPAQSILLRPWAAGAESDRAAASMGEPVITVDQWGSPTRPIRRAGVWDAVDSGGGRRGLVIINPDHAGANLAPIEPAALEAWLAAATLGEPPAWIDRDAGSADRPDSAAIRPESIRTVLTSRVEDRPTPAWLLVFVLALALMEMTLARAASHSSA